MAGANALAALRYQGGVKSHVIVTPITIPTGASNTDSFAIAPEDGELASVEFSGVDALVASDTNYITFAITNLGQGGIGTVPMLVLAGTSPVNTTKATGGTALAAGTRRSLTLNSAPNNKVKKGDRLRLRVVVTGTLPNTITGPVFSLAFVA